MQVRLCRDLKNGDLVALKVSGAQSSHVRLESIHNNLHAGNHATAADPF